MLNLMVENLDLNNLHFFGNISKWMHCYKLYQQLNLVIWLSSHIDKDDIIIFSIKRMPLLCCRFIKMVNGLTSNTSLMTLFYQYREHGRCICKSWCLFYQYWNMIKVYVNLRFDWMNVFQINWHNFKIVMFE